MAGWRVKSLAEDSVDVYTHTWSVLLFLFLACLLLLVPPATRPSPREPEAAPPKSAAKSAVSIKTTCWCPAQFEQAQVDYTNGVCGAKFIALQEGREFEAATLVTTRSRRPPPTPTDKEEKKKEDSSKEHNTKSDNGERTASEEEEDQKKGGGGTAGRRRRSLPLDAPVVLFLFAVCLRLPHLVWSMLSCCTGSVNLDQTLLAAKQGAGLDKDITRQIYTRVVQTTLGSMKNCQQRLTSLYLLMKTLMLIVIVAELVLVSMHDPLPGGRGNELGQGQQDGGDAHSNSNSRSGSRPDAAASTVGEEPMTSLEEQMKAESVMLGCFFNIRRMGDTHSYSVQCLFQKLDVAVTTTLTTPDVTYHYYHTYSYAVESVFSNVYQIVFSCLVILAVANGVNTGVLASNFFCCSSATKNRLGLPESSPRDLVLLIHMARTNLDGEVAAGLTEAAAGGGGGTDEDGYELFKK